MLDEIKQAYYENANLLKDWKKLSGNELCFRYVELKNKGDPLSNSYLSAIIYKFWGVAVRFYYSQTVRIASPEECYNWLIDSIQYVLDHHVWTDENHVLYKDEKAPEKAINVVFNSTKINYFVSLTRQKRKIDSTSISLEDISEEASESYFLPVFDNYYLFENELTDLIMSLYNNYKYFDSVCLDLILNEDLVEKSIDKEDRYRKLKWRLRHLDNDYAVFFAKSYKLDYNDVKKSIDYISSLTTDELDLKIDRCMFELKHNKIILDIFKE